MREGVRPAVKASIVQASAATVVVLVLGIGVICFGNGAQRVGHMFPGFLTAKNRIVLSLDPALFRAEKAGRILFSQVIAIEGHPIETAAEIDAHVAGLPVGTPVTYRFRKQADVFTATVEVQRFQLSDFFILYLTYFLAGCCFVFAGWRVLRRAPRSSPTALGFFVACQTSAVALLTAGDAYGPYLYTPLYLTAHCLVPTALLHFASTYPEPVAASRWRRAALGLLYLGSAALAVTLNLVADDASLFLPLSYTVDLMLANALLLYLGRLAIARGSSRDAVLRQSIRRALAAFVLSAIAPAISLASDSLLQQPLSPVFIVLPLAICPLLTASALRIIRWTAEEAPEPSARRRLSLLFLGAVETAFLAGIAVFWLNTSWKQLFDDVSLNHRQQELVHAFLRQPSLATPEDLAAMDSLVQTGAAAALVAAAAPALEHRDLAHATLAIEELGAHYHETGAQLDRRLQRLGELDIGLVAALVVVGVLQAVGFMIAARRWLMQPVEQLTVGTRIIATGNLRHRVQVGSAKEFATLAGSINAMAASVARMQERMGAEGEARHRAAAAARDAERGRLARELHDAILQDLSAVKLRLEGASRGMPRGLLEPAIEGLIQVIVDLRGVVDELVAPDLHQASLAAAIAAYAHVMGQGRSVSFDLDLSPTAEVVDWASRDVYRIAQEAIANAVRHGAPTRLAVRLSTQSSRTVLEVQDDGAGFDPRTVGLGTGIRGMHERAAAIGGSLDITTTPGGGTRIRLVVPAADGGEAGGSMQYALGGRQ